MAVGLPLALGVVVIVGGLSLYASSLPKPGTLPTTPPCGPDPSPETGTCSQSPRTTEAPRASQPTALTTAQCVQAVGLAVTVADHGAQPNVSGNVTVSADDSFFAPTCVFAVPSGTVKVTVRNGGRLLHNITVKDQAIDDDVGPGESASASVRVGSAPVVFFCKYHRAAGMYGVIVPAGE